MLISLLQHSAQIQTDLCILLDLQIADLPVTFSLRSQLNMVTLRTVALALLEHAPLGTSVQSIFNAI